MGDSPTIGCLRLESAYCSGVPGVYRQQSEDPVQLFHSSLSSLAHYQRKHRMTVIWLLWLPVTLAAPKIFPLVDPGLFVISGVKTCGGGGGYCLLGLDCTLDEDFIPDNESGQHCDGLKSAFTPSAHFVCCRATNKTAYTYKPPITLPSVTTAHTESTARTTTISVLENEIDHVLQKVAQSVSALKKSPTTQSTLVSDDESDETDDTSELRESEEENEEGDEEEEEMVADSPIEELWQEMPIEDDGEDLNLEENQKENLLSKTPDTNNSIPLIITNSDQTPKIEETSEEKKSEENTINPGKIIKGSTTEVRLESNEKVSFNIDEKSQENTTEEINQTKDDILKPTVQYDSPVHITGVSNLDNIPLETEDSTLILNDPLNEIIQGAKNKTESTDLEKNPDFENNLGSDEINEKSTEDFDNDFSSTVTPFPNVSKEATNEMEKKFVNEETQLGDIDTKIDDNINNKNPIPSINEIPYSPNPEEDSKRQTAPESVAKENDSQLPTREDENDTKPTEKNTSEPDDNQLVTMTISPVTHSPNAIQPTETQGQPGTIEPCAKVAGDKCTQEVKFVIKNETLCFGSVYALDWVVTSASCALRIFRAGMLDVIIFPLSETLEGHVKTIVVHESYAENSGANGQGMEANNIGLVQLHAPMVEWSACVPCLPEPGAEFSGVNCSAVSPQPLAPNLPKLCSQPGGCKAARSGSVPDTCEGSSRMMADDLGFSYLTLNCDILWEPRFYNPSLKGSGAPLYCGGVLAGVETGTGVGLMVYTPLTPYLPWLLKNTRPGTPEQTFNVG